jgi:DNA replication and repair protein RecF
MILRNISILNYKNIAEANLEFSNKINCFIGDNGEGKTNMLDAIYYLSFCHSMTTNIDSTLMKHETEFFMVQGSYVQDDGETTEEVSASMKRNVKKLFKRNKKSYKRLSEHIGMIPLIIVSPDDIAVILGGSEERRKLIDIVISQYDNTYIDALNQYNKALQQRNVLLKMDEEPDAMLMALWEEEMAQKGEYIYERRRDFVERFIPIFNSIYQRISNSKETVSLRYVSHCQRGPLLEVIQRDRHKDRAVGYSLHGIHRDDLEMLIDGYPLKREGSQGQNKSYVIALKLAQFDFLRQTISSTTPLLLLDDIFDKLDAQRVENIVKIVASEEYGQIFITDTNRDHLDKILSSGNFDYKIFYVKGGEFNV